MDIFINERSFDGSAPSHAARDLLREFYALLTMLREKNYPGAQIFTHHSFKTCLITPEESVIAWLSREKQILRDQEQTQAEMLAEDENDAPSLQPLVNLLLTALTQAPDVEKLIGEHGCYFENIGHDGTMLAAAAGTNGVLTSLGQHERYPDRVLTVHLSEQGEEFVTKVVTHIVTVASARRYRRRYVPNPKHHPDRPHRNATRMELDRPYYPFTLGSAKEAELRDINRDPPDTKVQKLLDSAFPGGRKLYNLVYSNNGKTEEFYEFMDDNMNGFHGYPVPVNEVPEEVVRALRRRCRER